MNSSGTLDQSDGVASRTTSFTLKSFCATVSGREDQQTSKWRDAALLWKFPDSAKVDVEPSYARDMLRAAERLPQYDNREFYSTDLASTRLKLGQ